MAEINAQLVERLCAAQNPREFAEWEAQDGYYTATCRVSREDVPGLIEIVRHWSDPDWRPDTGNLKVSQETAELLPVTAWRALAELKDQQSVQPLIDLLCVLGDEIDDWTSEELPEVFGKLGECALEPLVETANNVTLPKYARSAVVRGLRFVAEYQPVLRERVIACLTQLMENAAENPYEFNSSLLAELMDLNAVEAAAAIDAPSHII